MITNKFGDILVSLSKLDLWLSALGVKPSPDRIHHAIDVVRQAHEGWEGIRESGQPTRIGNVDDFYFGLVEALEFRDIFQAFQYEGPELLRSKLERALSGPLRPADETNKTSDGRNVMFELALAADLRLRGAKVSLGEPDIELTLEGQRFLVECKRPFREESIRPNVRGAARQLGDHLRAKVGTAGVIAISVTRIFNPGNKVFVVRSEQDRERLGDHVEHLMRKHKADWRTTDLHPAIAAVLFHLRTPGAIEDRDLLTTMSYTCVMPTRPRDKQFEVLERALPQLLFY